jgi:acyl-CoA thioesterase FadM
MTYAFEFFRETELIAKGEMTSVCCIIHPDRAPEPIPIPEWFAQALEAALD